MRFTTQFLLALSILFSFTLQAATSHLSPQAHSEGAYAFTAKERASSSKNSSPNHAINHHDDVWFHHSSITLSHDEDNDGYYSRIKIIFDLDTDYSSIEVYAALVLIDSQNHKTEYFITEDFWLHGNSAIDDYQIKTLLEENWQTDYYRLRVEIYDADDGTLLTSLDDFDDSNFDNLPLESLDNDVSYNSHYSFHEVSVNLKKDNDNDGFYQTFTLNVDADNTSSSRQVIAKIFIKSTTSSWRNLYTSQRFTLAGTTSGDLQHWDFDMLSGYRADTYQLKVELYDATSDQLLLATNSGDYPQLRHLKFEDASNDVRSNNPQPPNNNGGNKKTSSSGSGSLNIFTLFSLFGLLLHRRKIRTLA